MFLSYYISVFLLATIVQLRICFEIIAFCEHAVITLLWMCWRLSDLRDMFWDCVISGNSVGEHWVGDRHVGERNGAEPCANIAIQLHRADSCICFWIWTLNVSVFVFSWRRSSTSTSVPLAMLWIFICIGTLQIHPCYFRLNVKAWHYNM